MIALGPCQDDDFIDDLIGASRETPNNVGLGGGLSAEA
jgi:hypothetical protein